jgi:DNA-binding transcriptional LysR family regulator
MSDDKIGQFEWSDIRLFMVIVEVGSFGKAAEQVGLTQPTVSRRVEALESQIGKKLFNRTSSGAQLTEAGQALLSHAERMAASADAIEKMSMSTANQARGRVKVRLPDALAACVVVPQMQELLKEHPKLSIIIDCGIVAVDDSSPDIALQFLDPSDQDLVRRPVCWCHYSAFGARSYLEEHGTPGTLAEYATHRLIHHTAYYAHRESWRTKTQAVDMLIEDEHILVCDSGPLNLQFIEAGVGLGSLPTVVCEARPQLVALDLGCVASIRLNMYHAPGAEDVMAVSVVKDWLLEIFSPSIRWFSEDFVDPYEWRHTQG